MTQQIAVRPLTVRSLGSNLEVADVVDDISGQRLLTVYVSEGVLTVGRGELVNAARRLRPATPTVATPTPAKRQEQPSRQEVAKTPALRRLVERDAEGRILALTEVSADSLAAARTPAAVLQWANTIAKLPAVELQELMPTVRTLLAGIEARLAPSAPAAAPQALESAPVVAAPAAPARRAGGGSSGAWLRLSSVAADREAAALATLLDGGALRIYTGVAPATADDPLEDQVELVALRFANPSDRSIVDGVITFADFPLAIVSASGTATWFRASTREGRGVWDGSAGTDGLIRLADAFLPEGAEFELASLQLTVTRA